MTRPRPPAVADGRHGVFALSDAFVDGLAELRPTLATYLGIPGHDHEWDDTSPEGREAEASYIRAQRAALSALPGPEPDDRWARLAMRIFDEYADLELEPLAHGDHERDLGHLQSLFPQLRETFDLMDTGTAEGWRAIAARLATIGQPLSGWRACLAQGMAHDRWAARRQAESIVAQLRASVAPGGAFGALVDGFAASGVSDDRLAATLTDALAAAAEAVEDSARWLEQHYLPDAPAADGVGRERYQRHARAFLGTVLDLPDTYAWGWAHLGEIRAEMESLARELDPGRPLHEVIASMATDADTLAPSPEAFREAMLVRERAGMEELAGTHFDIPDEIRTIDVRLAPPGAALGAYFVPPSEDFSRPGTTWWSLGDRRQIPMWDEVSTAYHEGFPGHHLQCGLQVCLGDRLSRVHRLLFWLPGYGEGWALYAERLMRELGYLDRPEYVLGQLSSAALRAVRVVIDIGLHLDLAVPRDAPFHPGAAWSFPLAVEALEHYAFLPHDYAVSEVTRYLGWPAQAVSYKVGERAILALRDERMARDGAAFDLKSFHADVLGSGPVGLDHLRSIVLGD